MKIKVSKTSLFSKLRVVSKALKQSNDIVYSAFLFTPISSLVVNITASDEGGRIETGLDCMVENLQDKPFMIEATKLMAGLKDIPEQPITIEVKEKQVTVKYDKGKFEVGLLDASLYPNMKKIESEPIMISNEILGKGLTSVVKYASKDDVLRPVMAGIHLSCSNDMITFVGSNGHVLSMYEREHLDTADFEMIVPARYAKIISDILPGEGYSKMRFNDKSAVFETDLYTVSYRLIEGKYPNFRAVIPQNSSVRVELSCADLISATSRVSVFSNETSSLISLSIKGDTLTLLSENTSFSQRAQETIALQGSSSDFQIGFNGQFLVEILKTIQMYDSNCSLELTTPDRAGLIKPVKMGGSHENLSTILMPLMINN